MSDSRGIPTDKGELIECKGQSLSRAEYAILFHEIGTQFGAEDDEHFNLPNRPGGWMTTGRPRFDA